MMGVLGPYGSLFLSSFLAATVIPFSSEALLLWLVQQKLNVTVLLITASVGNIGGSMLNYYLGYKGRRHLLRKWLRLDDATIEKAEKRYTTWGVWSLLLAWVPVIGDPLTVAAGLFRTPFVIFMVLVSLSKTGRYIFLVYTWGLIY